MAETNFDSSNPQLGEESFPENLCPNCLEPTALIVLEIKDNKIIVNITCPLCKNNSSKEINEYFDFIISARTKIKQNCQREDKFHMNIPAEVSISKKLLCKDCALIIQKILGGNIRTLKEEKLECKDHFELYKYYCITCQKHLCEKCPYHDHDKLSHDIIDLEEYKNNFDLENFNKKIENHETLIQKDLEVVKNKIINNLKYLIDKIEDLYSIFCKNINSVLKLAKIFSDLFSKNKNLLNYSQIYNVEYLDSIDFLSPEKILEIKDKADNDPKEIFKEYILFHDFLASIKNKSHMKLRDSKILRNEEENKLVLDWIKSKGKLYSDKLIYRGTRDGDSHDAFFSKCKNKGCTLSLIEMENGNRFGGFTQGNWTNTNGISYVSDSCAFLFSIDNKIKFDVIKPECAISYFDNNYLQGFGHDKLLEGCSGLWIYSNYFSYGINTANPISSTYNVNNYSILVGNSSSPVKEMEVFQLRFH